MSTELEILAREPLEAFQDLQIEEGDDETFQTFPSTGTRPEPLRESSLEHHESPLSDGDEKIAEEEEAENSISRDLEEVLQWRQRVSDRLGAAAKRQASLRREETDPFGVVQPSLSQKFNQRYHGDEKPKKKSHKPTLLPGKRFLLDPSSRFVVVWSLIMVIVVLFSLTFVPFQLAFLQSDWANSLDLVIDFIFLFDMALTFVIAIRRPSGSIVTDYAVIAREYLTSWFVVDLIANFPYPLFITTNGGVFSIFRFLKFLRLFRIVGIGQRSRYNDVVDFILLTSYTSFNRVGVLLLSMFLFCHYGACIFFWISVIEPNQAQAWINRDFGPGYLVADFGVAQQYLCSLYWCFETISTLGNGDISPRTPGELAWAIVVILAGILFLAAITAVFQTILAAHEATDRIFIEKMAGLRSFCRALGVSNSTQKYVAQVASARWKNPLKRLDWNTVMNEFSEDVRFRIVMDLFGDVIEKCALIRELEKLSMVLTRRFISMLEPLQFSKNEYITRSGEYCDKMFIVVSGSVHVLSTVSSEIIAVISTGSSLGEGPMFMWPEWIFSVFCETKVHVLAITRTNLYDVVADDEEVFDLFRRRAARAFKHIQEVVEHAYESELLVDSKGPEFASRPDPSPSRDAARKKDPLNRLHQARVRLSEKMGLDARWTSHGGVPPPSIPSSFETRMSSVEATLQKLVQAVQQLQHGRHGE